MTWGQDEACKQNAQLADPQFSMRKKSAVVREREREGCADVAAPWHEVHTS